MNKNRLENLKSEINWEISKLGDRLQELLINPVQVEVTNPRRSYKLKSDTAIEILEYILEEEEAKTADIHKDNTAPPRSITELLLSSKYGANLTRSPDSLHIGPSMTYSIKKNTVDTSSYPSSSIIWSSYRASPYCGITRQVVVSNSYYAHSESDYAVYSDFLGNTSYSKQKIRFTPSEALKIHEKIIELSNNSFAKTAFDRTRTRYTNYASAKNHYSARSTLIDILSTVSIRLTYNVPCDLSFSNIKNGNIEVRLIVIDNLEKEVDQSKKVDTDKIAAEIHVLRDIQDLLDKLYNEKYDIQ